MKINWMNKDIIKKGGKFYYRIKVYGSILYLPLFEVAPKTKIALFNMLGETKLIQKFARALAKKLPQKAELIVTPEVKSICLSYELSKIMKIPYVVARKNLKPYMEDSLGEEVVSITTGKPQTLWLDGKDRGLVKGKRVILVDDVVSTGNTFQGLKNLMKKGGAKVIAEAAVFIEGDKNKWKKVICLSHLPVFNF